MTKTKVFTWLFVCGSIGVLNGQSIQNQVIATSGERMAQGGVSLDYTVGEPVVDFYDGTNDLHQGFHQVQYNVVVTDIETPTWAQDIRVFPNPTSGYLQIDAPDQGEILELSILDSRGRVIQNRPYEHGQYDISNLTEGQYFLHLIGKEGAATYQIIKINK